jgi:hypothetical protein
MLSKSKHVVHHVVHVILCYKTIMITFLPITDQGLKKKVKEMLYRQKPFIFQHVD